ncbi:regulatory protein RecX [Tessaracoccus sp.]
MRSISDDAEVSRDEQLEFARRIALNLLETRARSADELRRAMARKSVSEEISAELLGRLEAVGLVDDQAFATALVNTRTKVARRGARHIRQELREKGVPEDVAEVALAGVDPQDALDAAMTFASKKVRSMQGVDPVTVKRRLYGALARRGFSADMVRHVVDAAMGDVAEPFEE